MRLIIATQNSGKLREIKSILKDVNIPIVSLSELDRKFRIRENGKTFLENALKKAFPVSKFFPDDFVVGEDSGLEVGHLGNRPGIFSKRYSGKGASDIKNNRKILKELEGVENKNRTAWFRCCLAVAKNGKLVKVFEGRLKGRISYEMIGSNGFGYDPIFYLPKYRKTVAQLPLTQKNKISHRAKAFRKLHKYFLRKLI